jgi:hypothetical protein
VNQVVAGVKGNITLEKNFISGTSLTSQPSADGLSISGELSAEFRRERPLLRLNLEAVQVEDEAGE